MARGRGRPWWSSSSLRWLAALVVLLAAAVTGSLVVGSRPGGAVAPISLEEAVRRTLAAGSARLVASVGGAGSRVDITGVTSLVGPEAEVQAVARGGGRVDVRVTAAGAWLRTGGPEAPWTAVPAGAEVLAAAEQGWAHLLAGLEPAGPPRPGVVPARSAGRPARIHLDARGRIGRLVIDGGSATLDLRLADFGVPLHVEPP